MIEITVFNLLKKVEVKRMKIVAAYRAPIEQVEEFLHTTENVEKQGLLKDGYIVYMDDRIQGCFRLTNMEADIYWLKQLYIAKEAAASLPVLIESILQMLKGQNAKKVYVHSHQPVVDLLLEALQFYPHQTKEVTDKYPQDGGNWWAYQVS